MARTPDKLRRPGYAPGANAGVGRRGLHTRDRILGRAAEVFLANGFHATSLDAIAKAAGASRATVYQYFAGKEEIFRELSALAEREVLAHGEHLDELGPTVDGVDALHRWLVEWADIYDTHAAVFAEFPGIGTATGLSVIDASTAAYQFDQTVTDRLRATRLRDLDADDAAAALGRILLRPGRPTDPARTIAVLAPSGGCGTSTVAVNLAAVLAAEHRSALLIDLNLSTGDSAALPACLGPTLVLTARTHNVPAVLCVTSGGLLWLFLANTLERPVLILPYTLAFAAATAARSCMNATRREPLSTFWDCRRPRGRPTTSRTDAFIQPMTSWRQSVPRSAGGFRAGTCRGLPHFCWRGCTTSFPREQAAIASAWSNGCSVIRKTWPSMDRGSNANWASYQSSHSKRAGRMPSALTASRIVA